MYRGLMPLLKKLGVQAADHGISENVNISFIGILRLLSTTVSNLKITFSSLIK